MKTFTALVLVVALCVEGALSLHCYRCEGMKSHAECRDTIKCTDLDKYCVSVSDYGPGNELTVRKWCSFHCPTTFEIKSGKSGVLASCCETDYCNDAAASSVKTSSTVILLAMLSSFFFALCMGL